MWQWFLIFSWDKHGNWVIIDDNWGLNKNMNCAFPLILSWRRYLSYRNQFIDLLCNQWTGLYIIGTSVIKELTSELKNWWIASLSNDLSEKGLTKLWISIFERHPVTQEIQKERFYLFVLKNRLIRIMPLISFCSPWKH